MHFHHIRHEQALYQTISMLNVHHTLHLYLHVQFTKLGFDSHFFQRSNAYNTITTQRAHQFAKQTRIPFSYNYPHIFNPILVNLGQDRILQFYLSNFKEYQHKRTSKSNSKGPKIMGRFKFPFSPHPHSSSFTSSLPAVMFLVLFALRSEYKLMRLLK